MLIDDFTAIALRGLAEDAMIAHEEGEKINREIEDLKSKIDLLYRMSKENLFVAAVAPVADMRQHLEDLLIKRAAYAEIEGSSLIAMRDKILEHVTKAILYGNGD